MWDFLWCYNPSKIIKYCILHDESWRSPFRLSLLSVTTSQLFAYSRYFFGKELRVIFYANLYLLLVVHGVVMTVLFFTFPLPFLMFWFSLRHFAFQLRLKKYLNVSASLILLIFPGYAWGHFCESRPCTSDAILKITYVLDKDLRQLSLNSFCLLTFNGLWKFVKMKIPDFEQWVRHFIVEFVNAQIQRVQSGVKIYSPPKIYMWQLQINFKIIIIGKNSITGPWFLWC